MHAPRRDGNLELAAKTHIHPSNSRHRATVLRDNVAAPVIFLLDPPYKGVDNFQACLMNGGKLTEPLLVAVIMALSSVIPRTS